ncbi:MAG: hypothetical protein IKZ84_07985 [Victivallales bacterium]|nr:hypothetical protein [Victivallales bacterium]
MRIISKFHDYYDVFGNASDTSHVWKRETSSFLPDMNDPFFQDRNWKYSMAHQMDAVLVPIKNANYEQGFLRGYDIDEFRRALLLFCGEFYPFVRLADAVCWDFDSLAQKIDLQSRRFNQHSLLFKQEDVVKNIRGMFSLDTVLPRFKTMNLRYKCPIILLDIKEMELGPIREHEKGRYRVQFTLNPCLASLDFQKIMPPFDACQQLESYLFNELATQDDPLDEASDIVKRDSHGFDKHSFKAEPGKPKRSRKQHGSL